MIFFLSRPLSRRGFVCRKASTMSQKFYENDGKSTNFMQSITDNNKDITGGWFCIVKHHTIIRRFPPQPSGIQAHELRNSRQALNHKHFCCSIMDIQCINFLTLVLLNPDMPCLSNQYRSRSVGFSRSQLICWSGSALFVIKCVNLYQQHGPRSLTD